jgi:hypothetical protein
MTKVEFKDHIDAFIYRVFNIVSQFLFLFDRNSKKILIKNKKYFNKHKDSCCFILGTGPSLGKLSEKELLVINKEIVFGVNSLYKSKIGLLIKPQYYSLMDNVYWGHWDHTFKEVIDTYKDNPPVFITDLRAKKLVDNLISNSPTLFLYAKKYPVNKISCDLTSNIHALMNVVSFSILTAIFMGFKKIYLLGCDYNSFCNEGYGHCYDDAVDVTPYDLAFFLRNYWYITEFHYLLGKLAIEKGVEVINLTPNSLLDAYPRSTMKEVFLY